MYIVNVLLAAALLLAQQPIPCAGFTAGPISPKSKRRISLHMKPDALGHWMLDSGSQAHDFDDNPFPVQQRPQQQDSWYDYENSMDKQEDLWREQHANENFIENPYGNSRHGQSHPKIFDAYMYDREDLYQYNDVMPNRGH